MPTVLLYFFGDISPQICAEILTDIESARSKGRAQLSYEFNTTEVEIDLEEERVTIYNVLNSKESIILSLRDFVVICDILKTLPG